MDTEKIIGIALSMGFSHAGKLDANTIVLRPEVREMCASGNCGRYGKSWSCPPGCGSLEECAARIAKYSEGIIVQTTGELKDELDGEGMMEAAKKHGETFRRFSETLRNDFPTALAIGNGSCNLCSECTYPDEPCRDPNGAIASMEALGMVVSDVCIANSLPYYYGKGTITYVGCFLLK